MTLNGGSIVNALGKRKEYYSKDHGKNIFQKSQVCISGAVFPFIMLTIFSHWTTVTAALFKIDR